MARHFTKRIYGPYFPYNHSPHSENEDGKKSLEYKIEQFWIKIKDKFIKK